MDAAEYGFCNLCDPPRRIELESLLEHMRFVHDRIIEVARWPDGEPVIVDQTLEPCDFDEERR